jgi:hypothetical protein
MALSCSRPVSAASYLLGAADALKKMDAEQSSLSADSTHFAEELQHLTQVAKLECRRIYNSGVWLLQGMMCCALPRVRICLELKVAV